MSSESDSFQSFKDALGGDVGGYVRGNHWECADCDAHGESGVPGTELYIHRQKARHWGARQ